MLWILVIAVALGVWLLALLPLAVPHGKAWVHHDHRDHPAHRLAAGDPDRHRLAA